MVPKLTLPKYEVVALNDLYNSTEGEYWKWRHPYYHFGYPWNFTKDIDGNYQYDPCSELHVWQGISCELVQNENRITILEVNLLLLRGSLPPTLSYLNQLKTLNFSTNLLSGTFPIEYENFTHLETFDINHNYFSGPFPEFLLQLNNLTFIKATSNHFSGIIPSRVYTSLPSLTSIDFGKNYFHGQLLLTSNSSWGGVIYFNVHNNLMSGSVLKSSFESMPSLAQLGLNYNFFTGPIPKSLCSLTNLFQIFLDHAYFTGSLPTCFSNFTYTIGLALDANKLTGTIPNYWNLTLLQDIYLNNNFFTGPFPEQLITNSKDLVIFDVSNNYLTGTVSSDINDLNNLNQFYVQSNYLVGTFLESLSGFQVLENFNCSLNYFTGSISSNLSNAYDLSDWDVSSNMFEGRLPNMSQLYGLEIIFVGNNHFSGDIKGLVNADNLKQLRLKHVDVSGNELTGDIPEDIFNLRSLVTFAASKNCFIRSIPLTCCNATRLNSLSLDGLHSSSNCQTRFFPSLSYIPTYFISSSTIGTLPDCIFNLPNLTTLHVSGNGFDVELSDDTMFSDSLSDLSLSHNSLYGSIPLSLQRRSWSNLDLSFNKIRGSLSSDFSSITNGSSISLDVNRLSGVIPSAFFLASEASSSIRILDGNIFSCSFDKKNSLPSVDSESVSYQCGSNSFDATVLGWLCLLCVSAVFAIILFVKRVRSVDGSKDEGEDKVDNRQSEMRRSELVLSTLKGKFNNWIKYFNNNTTAKTSPRHGNNNNNNERDKMLNNSSFVEYGRVLYSLRVVLMIICGWIMVFGLVVYVFLHRKYSSYDDLYAWSVSAGFLSGVVPGVVLAVLFCLFLIGLEYMCSSESHVKLSSSFIASQHHRDEVSGSDGKKDKQLTIGFMDEESNQTVSESASHALDSDKKKESRLLLSPNSGSQQPVSARVNQYLKVSGRLLVCVSIILVANGGYLYISFNYRQVYVSIASVFLALFKLIWTYGAVVPIFSNDNSHHKLRLKLFVTIFIYTLVPCLATAVINSNCFFNVFVSPPLVQSSYSYLQCDDERIISTAAALSFCISYVSDFQTISFIPPFSYNYQCSSSILTSYAYIFVLVFIMSGILLPASLILLVTIEQYLRQYNSPSSMKRLHQIIISIMPPVLQPFPSSSSNTTASVTGDVASPGVTATGDMTAMPHVDNNDNNNNNNNTNARESQLQSDSSQRTEVNVRRIFFYEQNLISITSKLSCIVTFGVVFPPIAIIGFVSLVSETYCTQLSLGRYLHMMDAAMLACNHNHNQAVASLSSLNAELH
eukprot:gene14650-19682_t